MKIILLCAALLLAACTDPIATKPEDAKALVDHITYTKDKRGICYAVISVHRFSTSGSLAEHVIFTSVDCEKAGL